MRLIDANRVIIEAHKERGHYQLQENMPHADCIVSGIRKVMRIIEESPTVDPVKHGHWIKKPWLIGTTYVCSRCQQYHVLDSHYCPECGAKMDEEETHEG